MEPVNSFASEASYGKELNLVQEFWSGRRRALPTVSSNVIVYLKDITHREIVNKEWAAMFSGWKQSPHAPLATGRLLTFGPVGEMMIQSYPG
jgi:hypothetical protein